MLNLDRHYYSTQDDGALREFLAKQLLPPGSQSASFHTNLDTYASEMIRSSVTLPALMKLLGHVDSEMTMRYVDITSNDLPREYHLARAKPRHLIPQPKAPTISHASAWTA